MKISNLLELLEILKIEVPEGKYWNKPQGGTKIAPPYNYKSIIII